ncbi:protein of unknown function [Halomicrobium zhouii]|uniref:Protein-glutamine gamma-glutamyltransferase-like C-terminal domain-containing protein n=1 Tax=Halomicrobium zhouii TaxID=767519 RepID=A0A1I6KK97_9EURY|nr:DUF4129 domain-containing protein [Halomicrobium zhouii]SFR91695.1 protein of unknown function [Halomicrobium zhouii]
MDERAILVVVVVLGVVGLSASAASIGDSRDTRSVGTGTTASEGVGEGGEEGMGSGPRPSIGNAGDTETPQLELVPKLLAAIAILALVVPLLLSLVLYGFETVVEFVRSVLQTTTGVLASVLYLGVVIYLLTLFDGEGAAKRVSGVLEGGGSGSSFGPALSVPSGNVPLVVVALGGLVVVVAVVLFALRSTSGPSLGSPDTEPVADDPGIDLDSPREGPEGGRTAESGFADVEASNPVYRAWREMAETADGASLRTHTPGEVARRAVDAGMDRDAVRTLTEVFDRARYGPGVDEESERRARSALAAITEGEET